MKTTTIRLTNQLKEELDMLIAHKVHERLDQLKTSKQKKEYILELVKQRKPLSHNDMIQELIDVYKKTM